MSRHITFSFLLVEMTTHFRNRFGNRYCQNFSISRMSMNSCPLNLILRNGSPCVEGCLFSNIQKLMSRCILFPSATFRRDINISTSSGSTMVKNPLSTKIATRSFSFCQTELIAPIRDGRIGTDLIHGKNCLKQEFRIHSISIEVNGTFPSSSLQDSTTQSAGTCEDGMTCFLNLLYHYVGCSIPLSLLIVKILRTISLPNLDPWMSNVMVRISSRNPWRSLRSRCNCDHRFSTECLWTFSNLSDGMFFSSMSFWICWRKVNVVNPWKIFTRIQLLLHRFQQHLDMVNIPWDLQLVLSIFFLLLPELVPVDQHMERCQRRHKLLPSPIWSLDRWPKSISAMMAKNIPGISHSERLRNVLWWVFWLTLNTFSMFSNLVFL